MKKKIAMLLLTTIMTVTLSACGAPNIPFLNNGDEIDTSGGGDEQWGDLENLGGEEPGPTIVDPTQAQPDAQTGVEGTGMLGGLAQEGQGEIEPMDEPDYDEDKSNWPFNRLHPELFMFRFDGTTAYIGDIDFTGQALGNSSWGGNYAGDTNRTTLIESSMLPTTLKCKNNMSQYNLTSGAKTSIAEYWNNDIEITVGVYDSTRANNEADKINYPADFTTYQLRRETAQFTMEHVTKAELVLMDYTLKSNGTEGTGAAMLLAMLDNDNVIIVRNVFNDPTVTPSDLINVLVMNAEWVK